MKLFLLVATMIMVQSFSLQSMEQKDSKNIYQFACGICRQGNRGQLNVVPNIPWPSGFSEYAHEDCFLKIMHIEENLRKTLPKDLSLYELFILKFIRQDVQEQCAENTLKEIIESKGKVELEKRYKTASQLIILLWRRCMSAKY